MTATHPPLTLPSAEEIAVLALDTLALCGAEPPAPGELQDVSPVSGTAITSFAAAGPDQVDRAVAAARDAFASWRTVPAPRRADVPRRLAALLTDHRDHVATLISLEVGKPLAEARGEVSEMIEMCELAVGLARRITGSALPSQRDGFHLVESWHPLGPSAVISPFSFPAATWSWSAPVALVCGNPVIWKPSEHAPLTALAVGRLLDQAVEDCGAPTGLGQVLLGGPDTGRLLAADERVALVRLSGSTATGRDVALRLAASFRRAALHLSGNNASIVTPSADLDLVVEGVIAAATSAAGQRCTTMRRLIVARGIVDEVVDRLASAYSGITVGSPLAPTTRVGPLLNAEVHERMQAALRVAGAEGGRHVAGGERLHAAAAPDAFYVSPAIVVMPDQHGVVQQETLGPLLWVMAYDDLDEAIAMNNDVAQGFSSSIYGNDHAEIERFLSASGSDCGVVNVNLHTSGAEVGAAFGGNKETGGGHQCGSDTWTTHMRRTTSAIR